MLEQPGRAFGTGLHATTALVAEMLHDRKIRSPLRVCSTSARAAGSSRRSAALIGAASALAIDDDPRRSTSCARTPSATDSGSRRRPGADDRERDGVLPRGAREHRDACAPSDRGGSRARGGSFGLFVSSPGILGGASTTRLSRGNTVARASAALPGEHAAAATARATTGSPSRSLRHERPAACPVARIEAGASILDEDASRYVARCAPKAPRRSRRRSSIPSKRDRGRRRDYRDHRAQASPCRRGGPAVTIFLRRAGDAPPGRRARRKFDVSIARDATRARREPRGPRRRRAIRGSPGGRPRRAMRRIAVEAARQCGRGDARDPRRRWTSPKAQLFAAGEGVSVSAWISMADAPRAPRCRRPGPEVESRFRRGRGGFVAAEIVGVHVGRPGLSACSRWARFTLRVETVCAAVLRAVVLLSR